MQFQLRIALISAILNIADNEYHWRQSILISRSFSRKWNEFDNGRFLRDFV